MRLRDIINTKSIRIDLTGDALMLIEERDAQFYTVEVGRDLPLSEQLHDANEQLCFGLRSDETVFLEDIRVRNGFKVLRYRFLRDKPFKK